MAEKTFKHSDLVTALASDYPDLPAEVLRRAVDTITDAIAARLHAGGRVELRGFGSLWTTVQGARTGRNPVTGASVDISARRHVRFRPGKGLLGMLNR